MFSDAPTFHSGPGQAGSGRPIDLVHLSRQSLGDRALETELLSLFERQAHLIVARMAGPELDGRAFVELAHTLKGSALVVGAWRVAEAARKCEQADGRTGKTVDDLAAAEAEARAAIRGLLAA